MEIVKMHEPGGNRDGFVGNVPLPSNPFDIADLPNLQMPAVRLPQPSCQLLRGRAAEAAEEEKREEQARKQERRSWFERENDKKCCTDLVSRRKCSRPNGIIGKQSVPYLQQQIAK